MCTKVPNDKIKSTMVGTTLAATATKNNAHKILMMTMRIIIIKGEG